LEKLDENGYIEEKPEVEVELNDPSELRGFLEEAVGLELDSHRQKLRTSYRLKTGQLVELNESPAFETHSVPFWLEIEAESMAEIEAAAKALGYDKNHFFKGSDKKFLMANGGLSEAETKIQLF
jgi:adenylate cyclase class IV